jgi:DNA-3-methyladenine glycosylase
MPLPVEFYDRPTLIVARALLGVRLVRILDGVRLSGLITETEAYIGQEDQACHARAGLTSRTRVMYGPPGRAYVYFNYGMHWMLNVVTQPEGFPAAVLIRALQLESGVELVASRRGNVKPANWTNGPAKLTQAFGIDGSHHDLDLTSSASGLWLEPGVVISDTNVTIGARVGLYNVPEPWKSLPWRFLATV